MRTHTFDVLHVQTPHHPLLAQRIIRYAPSSTAIIGTFHILPYGRLSRWGTRLLGFWLKPSLKRFDKMLAVSSAAAQFEEWSFRLPAEVLPNVIDYKRFNSAKPLTTSGDRSLTVLFLGRLVPRKGCELLLKAVHQLKQQPKMADFKVVICGRGPLLPKLEKYVKECQLENVVTFAGFVSEDEKPRYYASADIAVFPSSGGESFGIVLLEAMAGGKSAVLAGDNPGYRSVLDSRPDMLFNPCKVDDLAEKLSIYLSNKAKRDEARKWGAEYTTNFDVELVGAKLLSIYKQALRKKRVQ